jgi:DnaJ homolog subfamily C member 17
MKFDFAHRDQYKKLNSIKVKWPKETVFSESMLKLLFRPYGPIKEVRIKKDKVGKAQVEFHTTEAANQAVQSE